MQTNRIFNKRFNKSNTHQFGGYNTLIAAPTRITLTGTYENIDLKIKDVLKDLEELGIKFYRNKINELTVESSGEISSANTQFIQIDAEDLPIDFTNSTLTIGFTDEELTKYKTILENYDIQGWGIQIHKSITQLTESLATGTNKSLKIRLFNSNYKEGNIIMEILPEIQIFEE